jgi:hypothetical protein
VRILAANPAEYVWIAKRAEVAIGPQFRAIKAVDEVGRIHGMVGYDGWTGNAVSMHVAIDNPAALRHLLVPGFRIPFVEFRKGVALAMVLSTNARSLKLVPRLGFAETHRIRDGWAVGVDLVMFEMRREDCRWLDHRDEKEAKRWAA